VLDCKGLELIRRDSCPLVAVFLRAALTALFLPSPLSGAPGDLSAVRAALGPLWVAAAARAVPPHWFVFAMEVRAGGYKSPPLAALVAAEEKRHRGATLAHRERQRFVVVVGAPGATLRERARDPAALLAGEKVDVKYYLETRVHSALQRLLGLVGVDAAAWRREALEGARREVDAGALAGFLHAASCVLCGAHAEKGRRPLLCTACAAEPQRVAGAVEAARGRAEGTVARLRAACATCAGGDPGAARRSEDCAAQDCAVLFERARAAAGLGHWEAVAKELGLQR
jgi:hypothetical protein